ncbi:MAG: hypothetical protein Q7K34_00570 [archaeon]|nr:hypothetical protein [archaeon]
MPLGRLWRTKFVRRLTTTPEQRAAEDARRALLTGQRKKTAGHARARHRTLGAHAAGKGIRILSRPKKPTLKRQYFGSEGHRMLAQKPVAQNEAPKKKAA